MWKLNCVISSEYELRGWPPTVYSCIGKKKIIPSYTYSVEEFVNFT
jgi:hypothetical protein